MLVYRQKGLNQSEPKRPALPDYQQEIVNIQNTSYVKDREIYSDLKNKIDIIIQDQETIFTTSEDALPLLTYIDDKEFYKVGVELRIQQSDSILSICDLIKKEMNLDNDNFDLFEVCKDPQNDYIRIMNSFKDALSLKFGDKEIKMVETVEDANKAKEYYITHQSTWMLVRGENVDTYKKLVNSLPLRLKIRLFGDEFEITTYNTVKISQIQQ